MQKEKLGYREAAREFCVASDSQVASWERIYLEKGLKGLYIERRGQKSNGRQPKKLGPEVEKDLQNEVQRLRAENAYLKNNIHGFLKLLCDSEISVVGDYVNSWKFIRKDFHSLELHTNFGIAFEEIYKEIGN